MSGNLTADTAHLRTRTRAKKACRTCNARRVRCNVMEAQPCNNCNRAGLPCELMGSKRGKIQRYSRTVHSSTRDTDRNHSQFAADRPSILSTEEMEASLGSSVEDLVEEDGNRCSELRITSSPSNQMQNGMRSVSRQSGISPVLSASTAVTAAISMPGPETTVYLGESNSITTFSNPNTSSFATDNRRLQYAIPTVVSAKTATTPQEIRRRATKTEALSKAGAFSFPPKESCETLFRAYFAWFHPCFPILDRAGFYNSYLSKTTSSLLLQAVLFVGASYCNEQTLKDIGLADRYDARSTFYDRAKDIYDADYETDKITVSQALFLISFWRAGPLLEKDTRHWLGAAISLAQTKGMHRSSSTRFSDAKLRKRIWWSLYVRDRQCSAALGLPIRIRDEDCDIEMLQESDLEDEDPTELADFSPQKQEHVEYAIQMAKLAQLLGKIILQEFAPSRGTSIDLERSHLRDELLRWEEELAPSMKSNVTGESFWAAMLHIAYNNLYILLYRSVYIATTDENSQDGGGVALQAACKNTRILEDLLAQELTRHGNVHLITSLFNSLCIHTVHLRRSSSSTVKKLAEYRAQLCLLGLRELQDTWDVTNWVLQLYFEFLDQSITRRLQLADNDETVANTIPISPQHFTGNQDIPSTDSQRTGHQVFGKPEWNSNRLSTQARPLVDNLEFASYVFGSQEAEDFSMFQLQPDLFAGDMFGGGLDQYYNSIIPRAEGPAPGQH